MSRLSVEGAKAQARALRQALGASGKAISHAEALEIVARQHGARDWNTLCARRGQRNAPPELALGDRVRGTYLGHPYRGEIVGLSGPLGHRTVEIRLDAPIDTVRFASFSNWRRRLRGTVDESGRSYRRTSDGVPQLVVEREAP